MKPTLKEIPPFIDNDKESPPNLKQYKPPVVKSI